VFRKTNTPMAPAKCKPRISEEPSRKGRRGKTTKKARLVGKKVGGRKRLGRVLFAGLSQEPLVRWVVGRHETLKGRSIHCAQHFWKSNTVYPTPLGGGVKTRVRGEKESTR